MVNNTLSLNVLCQWKEKQPAKIIQNTTKRLLIKSTELENILHIPLAPSNS